MQDLLWNSSSVPACEHSSQAIDQITVPPDVWVSKGLLGSLGSELSDGLAGKLYRHKSSGLGVSREVSTVIAPARLLQPVEVSGSAETAPSPSGQPLPSTSTVDQRLLDLIADGGRHVHVSQSAKNTAVRWILLGNFLTFQRGRTLPTFAAYYLRHDRCCVDCAISFVKKRRQGVFEHVGLIA